MLLQANQNISIPSRKTKKRKHLCTSTLDSFQSICVCINPCLLAALMEPERQRQVPIIESDTLWAYGVMSVINRSYQS